ncbi:DUF2247 family protein [Lysobacter sp. KIS68-7]|uniref:DUF2247 family protein n=1 Tax=Lysobacter sp. KIS68-7 TaxID=2904252 RepID=UPI001E4E1573|nr:DUF2247 family protein [Lysobacter sp. KIS68-7]UHQ20251.1 DUF2247 family protein [Lysobacter sp. KIS68-7]
MTVTPLSFEFVRAHASLTWKEAFWGFQQGLIDWEALKDLAGEKLCQGSEQEGEIALAGLTHAEATEARALAKQLADTEEATPEGHEQKVWLFLSLANLFLRRTEVDDALADVEAVYANYGYPTEIENFVRFMPTSDGYEPLKHSHEENVQRLYRNWATYLRSRGFDPE